MISGRGVFDRTWPAERSEAHVRSLNHEIDPSVLAAVPAIWKLLHPRSMISHISRVCWKDRIEGKGAVSRSHLNATSSPSSPVFTTALYTSASGL